MKYPFVFLIASVLLPTLVFVMLASLIMTELERYLDRKKDAEC